MMFKIFSDPRDNQRGLAIGIGLSGVFLREKPAILLFKIWMFLPLWILGMLIVHGCATLQPRLPPANFQEPGWIVHEGQAVWHLPKTDRDIAGEVLVAHGTNGRSFVQFTKSPFPIVVAQTAAGRWEVQFPPKDKRYAGRGEPPKRLIWLHLPRVLAGEPPPENWTWHQDESGWKLENHANGEALEGYFNP